MELYGFISEYWRAPGRIFTAHGCRRHFDDHTQAKPTENLVAVVMVGTKFIIRLAKVVYTTTGYSISNIVER